MRAAVDPELGGTAPTADYMAEAAMHHGTGADVDPEVEVSVKTKLSAMEAWAKLFRTLHIILHVLWIRLHHVVGNFMVRFVYGKPSQQHRRIVVIGDDYALGVGDWVTVGQCPGLQRIINKHLEEYVRKKSARVIRDHVLWTATSVASSGVTVADWLPRSRRDCNNGALFESAFDPNVGTDADADIVCVLLGAHLVSRADKKKKKSAMTIEQFSQHLEAICAELIRRKKFVLVGTVPLAIHFAKDPAMVELYRAKNNAIRLVVNKLRASMPDGANPAQLTLVDVADALKMNAHFRFGGRLMSGAGYNAMARAFLTALVPCVDAVETRNIFVKKMT